MNIKNVNAYPTEIIIPFSEAEIIEITNTGVYPITYNFDASVTASGNVTLQPGQSSNDTRSCTNLHLISSNGTQSVQIELETEISHQIGNLSVFVTPQMYGAKGDGVNNDVTASNSAMANAKGFVYLPKGTYLIDGGLSLTHSLIGSGLDTVILLKNGHLTFDADNIELSNLKIHSYINDIVFVKGTHLGIWISGTNYTVGTQLAILDNIYQCTTAGSGSSTIQPSGTSTAPVTYGDGYAWEYVSPVPRRNNVKIHDVYIEYDSSVTSNFICLDVFYTSNLKIYNNHFTQGGISLVQSLDFDIHDNYLDGLNANDNELCQVSLHSSGVINDNFFYNSNDDPLDLYSSGEKCIVTNNKFKNINMGVGKAATVIECKVTLRDSPYTGGSSDQSEYGSFENVIISNNIITDINVSDNGAYTGINIVYYDDRATPAYDLTKTARHVIVQGNIIKDFDVNHNSALTGIYFSAIAYQGINGIIAKNIIKNITTHGNPNWTTCGIYLGYASTLPAINITTIGCAVSGNIINTEASGIVIDYIERCTFDHNIVRKDESTGLDPKYGFYIRYSALDSSFSNNIVDCGATNANGLMMVNASTVMSRCTFNTNTFTRSTGHSLQGTDFCTFIGNTFNTSVNLGVSTVKYGNKFLGNTFNMQNNTQYGLIADNQKGMIVTSNTFNNANYALMLEDASNYCIIQNNISKGQTGTTFTRYYNMQTLDQNSCIDNNNLLIN